MKELNESHEGVGIALEEALKSPRVNNTDRGPLKYPKCGINMQIHKYRNAKEVNVDECYACGGFFLDSGELRQIKDHYMNEGERNAYVQKLIDETPFGQDVERAKLRTAGCLALGGLMGRRWPFI